MSTLKADTIVASDGTSPVTLTKQSAAKAWFNFNASSGTPTTRDSFNLSSITDNSTGRFGPNLTNAMSNTDYALSGNTNANTADAFSSPANIIMGESNVITTTASTFEVSIYSSSYVDAKYIRGNVDGDLA